MVRVNAEDFLREQRGELFDFRLAVKTDDASTYITDNWELISFAEDFSEMFKALWKVSRGIGKSLNSDVDIVVVEKVKPVGRSIRRKETVKTLIMSAPTALIGPLLAYLANPELAPWFLFVSYIVVFAIFFGVGSLAIRLTK